MPSEPILFTKSPNTLVGPDDDVLIPRNSEKTDWEVELGIVIGSHASYLADETEAAAAIAGYVLVNDVSEREWQIERGGQWSKGKSAPTFNPAGPYLVTPDEIGDVLDLDMWLDIDGVRRQTGSTSTMVFSPTFLVHYLSQFLALEPGDLINTGTPPGVGLGMKPPQYLQRRRDHDPRDHAAGHADTARRRPPGRLMRALVVTAPREAAVQDVPEPVAEPGQLVVDVERVGICGTDVEFYTGEMAYFELGYAEYPLRLGHEWAGRVSAVGDRRRRALAGQARSPATPCSAAGSASTASPATSTSARTGTRSASAAAGRARSPRSW